jgi:hypothetical protein
MSTVKFMLDEHLPNALLNSLIRREPTIDFVVVGRAGGPAKGTLDPQLL